MKKSLNNRILATVSLLALLMTGCAGGQDSAQNSGSYWKTLLGKKEAVPVVETSNSLSGNYLSGLYAQRNQDWAAASRYMAKVLESDQENEDLLQRTFLLALGTGDDALTTPLAQRVMKRGKETELAAIYLAADAIAAGDYTAAENYTKALPDTGFARYTSPLLEAWTLAGQKKPEDAIAILTSETNRYIPLYTLHAGFISEYFGRTEEARNWYTEALSGGLSTRSALSIGAFFERAGDTDKAKKFYAQLVAQQPKSLFVQKSAERYTRGDAAPQGIGSAQEGAAMAMFDLAAMLYEREAYESAMIYGRLAQKLKPDSAFVHMMMGDIMSVFGRYDEAVFKYSRAGQSNDLSWISRLRAAETLEISGRGNDALKILSEMLQEKNADIDVLMQIGDICRRAERFPEAVRAYDAAAAKFKDGKIPPEHWQLAYARGIALERAKDWPRAEADLLMALEYQPDNPMILNYLGYSWADHGINLDRALPMIRRAAELRPEDGYIADSYGWILYKTGEIEQAVETLEYAIELVPNDSVINDHLGDAYWSAGRKLEAQFQWQRALDLTQNAQEREALMQKLRNGGDAPPPQAASTEALAR